MDVFWGCGGAADDVTRFRLTVGLWWLDGWADVGERCPHQQAQEVEGPKPRPEDNDTGTDLE
jgi:hypothetical protein